MTKVLLTNTTSTPLGLPRGATLGPNASQEVNADVWASMEHHDVVKAWIDAGALKLGEASLGDDAAQSDEERIAGARTLGLAPLGTNNQAAPTETAATSGVLPVEANATHIEQQPTKPWATKDPAPAEVIDPADATGADVGGEDASGTSDAEATDLSKLTKDELKAYIEKRGGAVTGNPNKDELLKQASELPA